MPHCSIHHMESHTLDSVTPTSTSTPRVAFVMASSGGLGLASARALARSGHAVAVCARGEDRVREAVEDVRRHGPAAGFAGDVTEETRLLAMLVGATEELGPISTLVVNCGGPPAGGFDDLTSDQWRGAFDTVLMSAITAIRFAIPGMRERRSGRIVVIGSSSVRRPLPGLTLSNALRPAINGLVKDLAVLLAPDDITVNLVAPGRIDTDRVRSLDQRAAARRDVDSELVRRESEQSIPMGRYGTADELGAMVAFLCSPEAGYVTGQTILVDGGYTVSQP